MQAQQGITEKRLEAKIDWLEFTIKNLDPYQVVEDVLLLERGDFTKLGRGRFGYNSQAKWESGHVYLLYNEDDNGDYKDDDMGVHVLMTGQGCAAFNQIMTLRNLVMLVIGSTNYKFSRIDLAVDDIGDRYIRFNKLAKHAKMGHFVTKWLKWDEVNSRTTSDEQEYIGRTIYFGSQASDIFCRIYNKALEMAQKEVDEDMSPLPEEWTRLEIIYKKDRANLVAEHMVDHEDIGYIVKSTLNNYLKFVKPSKDKNRSRWSTYKWWDDFVKDAGKLQLTLANEYPDIDKMKKWVDKQISPTLAAIITAYEGDMEWLYSLIGQAKGRLKNKHFEAIHRYLEELERRNDD